MLKSSKEKFFSLTITKKHYHKDLILLSYCREPFMPCYPVQVLHINTGQVTQLSLAKKGNLDLVSL